VVKPPLARLLAVNSAARGSTENDVTGLDDESSGLYSKLKERAGHRAEWHHWMYELA